MPGAKNHCWEIVGACHGLVWFCCNTGQYQGLIQWTVLLYHPPLWGCPLPPPPIYLIPSRIGSTVWGPSGRRSWTRCICWSLGRATPALTGLCQKNPQSQREVELASNFKAVWSALVVLIHSSHCGSHPNPWGEIIFGEGKREQGKKSVTEISTYSLESILGRINSLIFYVGKNLIQIIHSIPCMKDNAKPT